MAAPADAPAKDESSAEAQDVLMRKLQLIDSLFEETRQTSLEVPPEALERWTDDELSLFFHSSGHIRPPSAADLAAQSARFLKRARTDVVTQERGRGVRTIARTPSGRKAWVTDEKACAICIISQHAVWNLARSECSTHV